MTEPISNDREQYPLCALCGQPVERVKPCGYDRFTGGPTCDDCCEECFQRSPFPCADHDRRFQGTEG